MAQIKGKKIMIVITKSNWGGAQRYVYDIATALHRDNDVLVVAGGNGDLVRKLRDAGVRCDTTQLITRDVSVLKDIKSALFLYGKIRSFSPDIVHLNSSKISAIGALLSKLSGVKKIIFTAHGWAFNENRSFVSKSIIKAIYYVTIQLSDKTIAVSNAIAKQVDLWPMCKNKLEVIHLGIHNDPILSCEESRLKLDLNQSDFIIGTIAELHPIKGLAYSIEAVCKTNLTYAVIGEGEERAVLENKKNTFLLGHIDGASRYMKAFDIFILPSLSEALGYVLLEAGLAQIPVIASDVGGIPEIVEDKISGLLVKPKDVDGIVKAIEYMRANPNEAQKMAQNLHEKVLRDFSIEKMISQTSDLYQK